MILTDKAVYQWREYRKKGFKGLNPPRIIKKKDYN